EPYLPADHAVRGLRRPGLAVHVPLPHAAARGRGHDGPVRRRRDRSAGRRGGPPPLTGARRHHGRTSGTGSPPRTCWSQKARTVSFHVTWFEGVSTQWFSLVSCRNRWGRSSGSPAQRETSSHHSRSASLTGTR